MACPTQKSTTLEITSTIEASLLIQPAVIFNSVFDTLLVAGYLNENLTLIHSSPSLKTRTSKPRKSNLANSQMQKFEARPVFYFYFFHNIAAIKKKIK